MKNTANYRKWCFVYIKKILHNYAKLWRIAQMQRNINKIYTPLLFVLNPFYTYFKLNLKSF